MPTYKKKINFLETEEGKDFVRALQDMVKDNKYSTEPAFSANTLQYPDNQIPFVNKHIEYLRNHAATDPQHYLANLRLITKKR